MRHALFAKNVLCASLLMAGLAQAQSLLELYEAAKANDAGYLGALSQKQATVAKADQSNLLPTVGLTASSTNNNTSTPAGDVHYKVRTAALSATQPLYKPALWASYQQGQVLYEQARAQLELAEQDLMVRISQAYFDVLVAHDTVALVKAQKAANAEQLAAAKRNFEVGTATITDTHEAQARYDLALAQEIAAENDVQIKQLALSTIVGRSALIPKPLRGKAQLPELQPAQMQQWVDQALAGNSPHGFDDQSVGSGQSQRRTQAYAGGRCVVWNNQIPRWFANTGHATEGDNNLHRLGLQHAFIRRVFNAGKRTRNLGTGRQGSRRFASC
jgi:outer membrane protein